MLVKTKYFGEIDLDEEKVLNFNNGIIGFADYKRYAILYDLDKKGKTYISWLQSLDEPGLALPVINPFIVKDNYAPIVNEELLTQLGELNHNNISIFLAITIPKGHIEDMTANLKAPFIINADTKKGYQIIVENEDYQIKYKIYDIIKHKEGEAK